MSASERAIAIGDAAEIMLRHVEEKTTHQTDAVMEVDAADYIDPDRWQKEIDSVFKRVPLMLAFTAEMKEPGDYKAMEAVGMPVLISRDKKGAVRAFLNVCSHRAAPVADKGSGNTPMFVCKYHGWTYGLDGSLRGVSEASTFGKIDKDCRGLRELPCEERAGMIFVVLDPDGSMDLDDYFQGYLGDFEDLDFANWTYLGSREIHGANWKVALDGYLEGYHFSSLHPETIHPRTPSNRMHYEEFGPSIRIGFPQHSIAEQLKDIPRDEWGVSENKGFDFVRILFPNVSAFIAPEITQIAQIFPGPTPGENRTVLNYLRRDPIRDDEDREGVEAAMNFFRDVTYEEDYLIGMDIQKGLASGAHAKQLFGKNERGNQYFHEWVEWYVAGDDDKPKPTL